jgi:hypothetical protein
MRSTWADPEGADMFAQMVSELDQARAAIEAGEPWSTGRGAFWFAQNVAAALGEQTGLIAEQREVAEKAIVCATLLGFGVGFKLGVDGLE